MNYWRSLLIRIGWSLDSKAVHSIAFTSYGTGQGVTTVAANVAKCAADSGANVLVVDGNLRRPQMHELFGVNQSPGLVDLLQCRKDQTECLQPTSLDHVRLLAAGDNSADLNDLADAGELFKSLAADFDLLVLDAPSISAQPEIADWLLRVDRVAMVVSHGQTNSEEAARASAELRRAGIELAGIIVNRRNKTHG